MNLAREESGFTLVEILVAIALFSVLSAGFYQVMLAGVGGGDTARNVARVSEESRLGFSRMVRDTREADQVLSATGTSYSVLIDFNDNGSYQGTAYERMRFTFDAAAGTITATALNDDGTLLESGVLMGDVRAAGEPVFTYSSNLLQYDTNNDGVTSASEMDSASGIGDRNGALNGAELDLISSVEYSVVVSAEDRTTTFSTEAQIRNRRYRT